MIAALHIRDRDVRHPDGRTLTLNAQDVHDLVIERLGTAPAVVDDWTDPNTLVVVDLDRAGVDRAQAWAEHDAQYTNRTDATRPQAGCLIRLTVELCECNGGRPCACPDCEHPDCGYQMADMDASEGFGYWPGEDARPSRKLPRPRRCSCGHPDPHHC